MAEILRLGFAGLGEAATLVLPEVLELPYIKVTAAADLRKDALERFQQEVGGKVYQKIEDLARSPDVDAIYIATPHEFHARHTLLALENRKHVIVEKPMALSLEDCEKMNTAAAKYGVKLLCGHTHSFDPPVRKMREIVKSGELGRLCMIHTWNYNDFMVRPYPDHELRMSHGVVLNQGPHQVDVVRLLGGGMVRSVRAMAGRWEKSRPGETGYTCYLEFVDGVAATVVYNGAGFFDTAELFWWIGEGGLPRYPEKNMLGLRNYRNLKEGEREKVIAEMKEQMRFGRAGLGKEPAMPPGWEKGGYRPGDPKEMHQPFFGLTVVTCEKGEMRQSPDGIYIYGDEKREIPVGKALRGRKAEVMELYEAVVNGKPMFHDGRWGEATLEVCFAILKSAAERREIFLSHQVPAGV